VTERVRGYIHERGAELLALQVFHPLGTQALQLETQCFDATRRTPAPTRGRQVDDLAIRVEVIGTDLVKDIGAGRNQDMFLEERNGPFTLYHDLKGNQWEDRVRVLAGPYLATLLENPAYGATFQILLQQETPAHVKAFLDGESVSQEELELVRRRMGLVSGCIARRGTPLVVGPIAFARRGGTARFASGNLSKRSQGPTGRRRDRRASSGARENSSAGRRWRRGAPRHLHRRTAGCIGDDRSRSCGVPPTAPEGRRQWAQHRGRGPSLSCSSQIGCC
jgi:hypothetical protein